MIDKDFERMMESHQVKCSPINITIEFEFTVKNTRCKHCGNLTQEAESILEWLNDDLLDEHYFGGGSEPYC